MSEYDFHTAVIDGERVAGVMFVAGTGQFYEFQDPDTHGEYEKFVCPRSGDVLTNSGEGDRLVGRVLGGRVRAMVAADKWADFRARYVGADEERTDAWVSEWKRMHVEARQ